MKFYVAIHRPTGYDHSVEITREVIDDIDQVNDEMVRAGIRVFVGGLRSPSEAKAIHRSSDGSLAITDGPFLETKEYIDGFWVLEVPTMEEAVEWGKKAAAACRGSVEVRPFH
ncbi:MAG: hypothetical protein JNM28_13265 [Armatimonadetes bacterium]|nr:hypothetical protein [Armatimonadota bacterium]MBS1711486.1 hypothetical protein [Armatimonadota bacterium]MBX3107589.1 hypothetical protein [Fimbriimonadaceae bacterium]